jgi:hypothetical protein
LFSLDGLSAESPEDDDGRLHLLLLLPPLLGNEMNLGTVAPGCAVIRTMAPPKPLGADSRTMPVVVVIVTDSGDEGGVRAADDGEDDDDTGEAVSPYGSEGVVPGESVVPGA